MKTKNKSFIAVIIIFMIISISFNVMADDITIKSISPSECYDSRPSVWGEYVVWRRAVNQNGNEKIELNEPSWIMLYNIKSGNSWNITEINKPIGDGIYCHAEAPDIWNGKIIYEAQINTNSSDTKLFMYNISSRDTWEIPLRSSNYSHGHLHGIYESWIVYTDIQNGRRQAYLYNYNDGTYRTIIGMGDNYSVYGMVMNEKTVVLTVLNETDQFKILFYDINSNSFNEFDHKENYTQIIATSINEDYVAICVYKNQTWSYFLYSIKVNRKTESLENVYGVILWENNIAYQTDDGIHLTVNGDTEIIEIRHDQYIGDIYENTLVWASNDNSFSFNGDARDNFDIYIRTVLTDEEMIKYGSIGLIIVIIVIGILVAVHRSKLKGMI